MERPDRAGVHAHVLVAGERAGHEELYVDALLVHLADAGLDVPVLGVARGILAAHEVLKVAIFLLARPGLPQVARLAAAPSARTLEAVPVLERRIEHLPCPPYLHLAQEGREFRFLSRRERLVHVGRQRLDRGLL